jgi:signal transduction histidine kinase
MPIAGSPALLDETRRSEAIAFLRDTAVREAAMRAVLRGPDADRPGELMALVAAPVGGDAGGVLVVGRRIEAADLDLARSNRPIELYVFERTRPEHPFFESAPPPWPLPGSELTADRAMRLGSLAKRWDLPEPFQDYEVVQVTHPRVAALFIEDASAWLALVAGLLVTALLGYIAFGEARRTRVIRMEVQSTTAALRRSNEQLEQFAVVASHDLRSPLRAIAALAGFVERDGESRLSANALANLSDIQARITKLSAMLTGLLEYARVGRPDAPAMLLESGRVAGETTTLLELPPGFQVRIAPDMPRIWSAKAPLELVFRNLVSNAIKHHDRREGHISISGRLLDSDLAEFTVADDGPGVPSEYRERIFNLFETLQPADTGNGIGLGLAIVRKVVQMNGGEVKVRDAPGRGAAFVFTWSTVQRTPRPEVDAKATP